MIPLAIKQTTGLSAQDIEQIKLKAFIDYCDYTSKGDHLLYQLMLVNKPLLNWAMIQIKTGEKNFYQIIANRNIMIKQTAAKRLYIKSIRAFIYSGHFNRSIITAINKQAGTIFKSRQFHFAATQTHLN